MGGNGPPPLVTVTATCFNHERYVLECLESIRAQTYPNVQLVIADDCSTDGSVALIRAWVEETGSDCTLVLHERNQGVCRTKNDVLGHARGKYVSSISTDDTWYPDKIATQVEQMEKLPDSVAVCYGDAALMDATGAPLDTTYFESSRETRTFERPPEGRIFEHLLEVNFIPAMATLIRRECLADVGGYDESLTYEDWDMWLRLARRYEFAFTASVGARYRLHPSSLWQTIGDRALESDIRIFSKHVGYSSAWDPVLRDRIARAAYRLGRPERLAYARANLRAGWSLHAAFLYGLCLARVPYAWTVRVRRALAAIGAPLPKPRYVPGAGHSPTETSL